METMHWIRGRWVRRLAVAALALLLLWALAWLAVPPLLKSQLEQRGSQALGRHLSLGAVDFKPWSLELTLSDIRIASADGKGTQLSIARLYADAEIQSLLRLAPVIDAIRIEQPHLWLTHQGAGQYDIDDLLQRFAPDPAAAPSAPPRFALYNVELTDGAVDFTDHLQSGVREHQLRGLHVALPFLSNLDSGRNVTVRPHLAFSVNGSAFDSNAEGTPFAATPQGDATLKIHHLDVAPYLPYLPASLPVRVRAAVLDGALTLQFAQAPSARVVISGALQIAGLQVDDHSGAPLLSVASLQTEIGALRPLERSLALQSLTINAPHLSVARKADGSLNLPMAAPSVPAVPQPQASAPAAAPADGRWAIGLHQLAVRGGQLRWRDASVKPAAQLLLGDVQLQLSDLQWPMAAPARLEASANLSDGGTRKARIRLDGQGTQNEGKLRTRVADLGLALAAPYLAPYLVPQLSGQFEGDLSVQWKDQALQLQAERLALRDVALRAPAGDSTLAARDLPSFTLLELGQLRADLSQHSLSLGRLSLQGANARLLRDHDGQWLAARWLRPLPDAVPASAAPAKAAPVWKLALAELLLGDGQFVFVDRMPAKPVLLELSALQARLRNLTLDGRQPAPLTLSAKLRSARSEAGSLRFDGSFMWDPLLAQGRMDASQLPLQALSPYLQRRLRLDVLRADTSFKGQVRYASLATGPDIQVQGDAAVEEFKANSYNGEDPETGSEELLSWKALSVPGIDLHVVPGAPLRLSLREVSLADFFARLIVNGEGHLVLQDMVLPDDVGPPLPAQAAASAPAALPAQIDVGPIRLVNGRVAFSDRFIQPHYATDLSELVGSLSHFSAQPAQGAPVLADLVLRGRAEGTASLEITGKLNPLAKPLALDIQGRVRDLELSPLSAYAAKFAGYGIERGKLSVDVHYSVAPDGTLQASNKLVLNQLIFGEAVPGASQHLPVKLAVALLADRNGVIDLDVPLSGSLNDPQFRIWPIVWKIVGNLISKALTSPFHLIAGLVNGSGGADELSNVAFDAGTAHISASAQPVLDKIARALADKPSLRLTVVGTASLAQEQAAIRRDRLNALVLAEKRRAAASAGRDVTAVADVGPDEYPALLKEAYQRLDIRKPRNMVGLRKDLPVPEMEALLLAAMPVTEEAAQALALNRSIAVRDYLTARQLPSDRVFLGASQTAPTAADWQPRAELNLEQH